MRSGDEYLASLVDGRAVYLDGRRVEDVTTHPAFANAIKVVADTYDAVNADPSLSYVDDETGERFSGQWLVPRSADDLRFRRHVHEAWARPSYGLMGRTPDHVASMLTAFRANSDVFGASDPRFGDNIVRFYEQARAEDLYVAYAIVPPQVDRSKPAHQQPEPFLYAGVSEEREDGVVINGAQMIGTGAAMADWLLLGQIVPLRPGDEDYAISCALPCNTPGLRIYPRRPYATTATSQFDYPLSSRFDEVDALIVFDNVFVPWEDVFVYRDLQAAQNQFHATGAHVLGNYQALCRFNVKLRFATGLAIKLAELHGVDKLPPVQAQLGGGVGTIATGIEALMLAAESHPVQHETMAWPSPKYVYTGMNLQRQQIVDLIKWLRELAGGAFIAVPSSSAAFLSAETGDHTRRYYQSGTASAEERVKLLRLMWDFVGTEFAGRQLQYEMFYSAAQHISDARVFTFYDWAPGREMVDGCLAGESLTPPVDHEVDALPG